MVKLETYTNLSGLYKKLFVQIIGDNFPNQIAKLNVNITLMVRCVKAARHLWQFWQKVDGIIRNILFFCKNNFVQFYKNIEAKTPPKKEE